MTQVPIHIIGAGLGGLTLARCLARRNVKAVVYEKAPNAHRHSYAISLQKDTYLALLQDLDVEEDAFRRRVAVDRLRGGDRPQNHDLHNQSGRQIDTPFRVNRAALESFLREGVDVRWGKALDTIEGPQHGTTTLTLHDGSRIATQCVIGADGVHSRTRSLALPGVKPKILPIVAINGKRRVTRSHFDMAYEPAMQGRTVVDTRRNGAVFNVQVNEVTDEEVSISWVYSRGARPGNDELYKPERQPSSASDIPAAFYDEIEALLVQGLEQPYKEVFDLDKVRDDRKLSWLMRTTHVSLSDLRKQSSRGIHFLGDAVHAQPILGGRGGNAAIADGMGLAKHIVERGLDSIEEWYEANHRRWTEEVGESEREIKAMHTVATNAL